MAKIKKKYNGHYKNRREYNCLGVERALMEDQTKIQAKKQQHKKGNAGKNKYQEKLRWKLS